MFQISDIRYHALIFSLFKFSLGGSSPIQFSAELSIRIGINDKYDENN